MSWEKRWLSTSEPSDRQRLSGIKVVSITFPARYRDDKKAGRQLIRTACHEIRRPQVSVTMPAVSRRRETAGVGRYRTSWSIKEGKWCPAFYETLRFLLKKIFYSIGVGHAPGIFFTSILSISSTRFIDTSINFRDTDTLSSN